jgi:hypothetical protein
VIHEIQKYLMLKLLFAGMSFTQVNQLRLQAKKLHLGTLLTGRAALTLGSIRLNGTELFDTHHPRSAIAITSFDWVV